MAERGVSSPDTHATHTHRQRACTKIDTHTHSPPPQRRDPGHRFTRHPSIYRPQDHPQMHLHAPLHPPHRNTYLYIPRAHTQTYLNITHAEIHAYRIHPLSQVQSCRGQTGIHKHAHTHKHIRVTTPAQHGLWCPSATCPQTHPSLPKSLFPGYHKKATSSSACDPGGAASRCSEPPLVVTPSPRHPYGQPSVPTRRRRSPHGAGLQSAQPPRAPTKAGRPQLAGHRRPRPRASPGPAALQPKPHPLCPRSARSLGRRTWVSQELEAEMGLLRYSGSAGLLGAPLNK